jgi:hypothetical protein
MSDENNFLKWLELNTDLSEKSTKNYVGAIKKISGDLNQLNLIQSPLEYLTSVNKLQKLKEQYFNIPEHKESNQIGKNMYSAAFNRLIDFRQSHGSQSISNEGIVYIISNPSMPGLVKIGKTNDLKKRMGDLFKTGVPLPFRCVYAKKVKNYSSIEKKLHNGLQSRRVNDNREFFRIAEDEVINFLEMLPGEEVTIKEDLFEDKEDQVAFEKATRVGQRFNFEMVGIKPGSILNFAGDDSITCVVSSKNKVMFDGEDHSLSSAALIAKNKMGFNWKTIAGPLHWKYEGEVLDDRRRRYEEGND